MKRIIFLLISFCASGCSTTPRAPALTYLSGDQLTEANKLGYQISDPAMRKKILDLYKRNDIVVEQVVIR